jgi:hypothetical protein
VCVKLGVNTFWLSFDRLDWIVDGRASINSVTYLTSCSDFQVK